MINLNFNFKEKIDAENREFYVKMLFIIYEGIKNENTEEDLVFFIKNQKRFVELDTEMPIHIKSLKNMILSKKK